MVDRPPSKFANHSDRSSQLLADPELDHQQMLIDKHFSFFQIETKLRDIVQQMNDGLKKQLFAEASKNSGLVARIDQLERNLTEQKNEIKKNEHKWKQFDAIREEIKNVQAYFEERNEQMQQSFTTFENFFKQEKEEAKADRYELRCEMKCIYDFKKDLMMYNKRLDEYKEQMNKRLETDLHLFTLEVAEIRKPQVYMQAMLEANNKQLQQYAEKGLLRRVDLNVVMEKVLRLQEQVETLERTKQETGPFNDLDDYARSQIDSLRQYYTEVEEV